MARGRRMVREVWTTPCPEVRYIARTTYTTIVVTVLNADAAPILEAVEIALKRSDPKKLSPELMEDAGP